MFIIQVVVIRKYFLREMSIKNDTPVDWSESEPAVAEINTSAEI